MLFKIFACVLLVATCVQHGATDTVFTQTSYPEPLGSCVSADCRYYSEHKKIDVECLRNYTVNGKAIYDAIYLRKITGNTYQLTDKNGKSTKKTMVIDYHESITRFTRYAADGKLEEICCATFSREISSSEKNKVDNYCNHVGMVDNDNANCK